MMHDPNRHPDDERLSPLAEGDPEATADRALIAHVASCDRCRRTVDELAALRTALSALPDVTPPRPLRLLPPAPEPGRGRTSLLRGLFAPTLAAGVLLAVAGGVGSFGSLLSGMAASGAAPAEVAQPATDQGAVSGGGQPAPSGYDAYDGGRNLATDGGAKHGQTPPSAPVNVVVWPVVLGAGLVLVAGALVLRYAVLPRAG